MTFEAGNRHDLSRFIQHPDNAFYYTETVRNEFTNNPHFVSFPDKYFKFIDSPMDDDIKARAPHLFLEMWRKRFAGEDLKKKPYLNFSDQQLDDISNDLLIVMEASCSQAEVDGVHSFLTNNMRLYRKIYGRPETKEVLDKAIGLLGLDHLIPANLLADILDKWEQQ